MPSIHLRLPDNLAAELDKRKRAPGDSLPEVIREIIERHLHLLARARMGLRGMFTPEETTFLVSLGNSTTYQSHTIEGGLLADAEDTEDSEYERMGVDRGQILGTLRSLSLSAQFALVDAIERFWADLSARPSLDQPDPRKMLDD